MKDDTKRENSLKWLSDFREINADCLSQIKEYDYRDKFFYYTSAKTAKKILDDVDNGFIWVNSLLKMNDSNEAKHHGVDSGRVFALCFSHQSSESIPMWYLYSGITGTGVRIGITPLKMIDFIEGIDFVYPIHNGDVQRDKPFHIGSDFSIDYGWVTYLGNKKAIQRDYDYTIKDDEDRDAIWDNNFFVKDFEWNYEKEFRIVFSFFGNPPERIAVPFPKKKMMQNNGGLSITLAPEMRTADIESISREYKIPTNRIKKSTLNISMGLLSRNRASIISEFDTIVDSASTEDLFKLKKILDSRIK